MCLVLSGASLARDSHLGSEHKRLGVRWWACERDIETRRVGPLISPLGVPSGPRAAIPHSLTSGGMEKRVMAGVGEEGRTDDVMREDHRERTQAVTVPTCASFPSGFSALCRRFLASSFVLLKEKKC